MVGPYRDSNPLRLTILAAMSEDYTTAPQHLHKDLPNFDDGELTAMISEIESGNTDPLLENDITVTSDVKACTRLLVINHIILRNSGAIEQYSKGLQSIDGFIDGFPEFVLVEGKNSHPTLIQRPLLLRR